MRANFRSVILLSGALLSVVMTACSGVASGSAGASLSVTNMRSATLVPIPVTMMDTDPTTLTPLAAANGDPNCPIDQLSRWLLYSTADTRLFIQYVDASANITPEQTDHVMTQLAIYRTPLSIIPIPACAAEESQLIFTMMDGAFNAIKNFSIHKQDTLSPNVALANLRYEQIKQREQQLQVLLEAMQNAARKK